MVKATSIISNNHIAKIIFTLSKIALIKKDFHANLKPNYPHAKNDIF